MGLGVEGVGSLTITQKYTLHSAEISNRRFFLLADTGVSYHVSLTGEGKGKGKGTTVWLCVNTKI